MYKYIFWFIFTTFLNTQPLFSQTNNLKMSINTAINSQSILGFYNELRAQNKSNVSFNIEYSKRNLSSQLSLNFDDHDKLKFDNSFVNYKIGKANVGIGKVDRTWSFSKKSSLILSSNSRPLEAISVNLGNKFNANWLPPTANWSVELINGSTKNSYFGKNSMLFGARVIINPSEQLNFEFIQTSQWGDQNNKLYSTDFDTLLFSNTNEGKNAQINKMGGFGLSYSMPFSKYTYRFYGQGIGEDEAGSLPSCYSWMAGLELAAPKMKFPTTLSIEAIDTRVKETEHGNCGANTMYNNGSYDYINYDTVLGVPIDTEGTSIELFGQSQLSKNLEISYSSKFLSINTKGFSRHRLSSKHSLGTITSLGIFWKKDSFNLGGNISYQNIVLDRADISNGKIFSLFTSIKF
jgi:hypothetical protein